MTAIARLEVVPVGEERLSDSIAQAISALDGYDVGYETTATDTIIEAETADELFDALKAAHGATPGGRVITSVEIDDIRGRDQRVSDRVSSVERALGRPPRRQRTSTRESSKQPATTPRRYGQPRNQSPMTQTGRRRR
ncbi:thiamine-binding protein [Haladaptatus sp. DFWS20]|uniref:thiamine-binding protein n=1 Tax=Haladaptatus sp. DFWS20 TaxID=3403467 RepID=UPI003EB9D4E6